MNKVRRFTKIGIVEGFKIYSNEETWDEVWIIKGRMFRINKNGDVIPVQIK